jgi:hypothetical protein
MRKNMHSVLLAVSGVCLVLAIGVVCNTAGSVYAQDPPPRPTLTPEPVTATPQVKQPEHKGSDPTALLTGRITGTVIEARSGAPAAGVNVRVGEVIVTTDSNGNYDRGGLPAGEYPVELVLSSDTGIADQGVIIVPLESDSTAIQHLSFHMSQETVASPSSTTDATLFIKPTSLPSTGTPRENYGMIVLVVGISLLMFGLTLRRHGKE